MDKSTNTTIDVMTEPKEKPRRRPEFSWPMFLLTVGILLIGASYLPVGDRAAKYFWTTEDSALYDQVSQEYKRGTYQSAARSGVTEEEWNAQRDRMKQQVDTMRRRLEFAQEQPEFWSRNLLWVGFLLVVAGGASHYWGARRA